MFCDDVFLSSGLKKKDRQFIYKKKLPRALLAPNSKRKYLKRHPANFDLKMKVPNYIEPIEFYLLPLDIILYDLQGIKRQKDMHSYFEGVNHFKKVTHVDYDSTSKLLCCFLESRAAESPPVDLLIERLFSLGDKDAFDLGNKIKNLVQNVQYKEQMIRKLKGGSCEKVEENKEKTKEDEEIRLKFFEKVKEEMKKNDSLPLITFHYHFDSQSQRFELYEIAMNSKILDFLCDKSEDLDSFILSLMKNGFPDVFFMHGNIFKGFSLNIERFIGPWDNISYKFLGQTGILSKLNEYITFDFKADVMILEENDLFESAAFTIYFEVKRETPKFNPKSFNTINEKNDEFKLKEFLGKYYKNLLKNKGLKAKNRCGFRKIKHVIHPKKNNDN